MVGMPAQSRGMPAPAPAQSRGMPAPAPDPEPAPEPAPEPTPYAAAPDLVAPCRDVHVVVATLDREELFRTRMAHANLTGTISFEQWDAEYGPVTHEYPWGIRFWAGFERTMHRYLSYHLRCWPFDAFKRGYFKKPAPFMEPKGI